VLVFEYGVAAPVFAKIKLAFSPPEAVSPDAVIFIYVCVLSSIFYFWYFCT